MRRWIGAAIVAAVMAAPVAAHAGGGCRGVGPTAGTGTTIGMKRSCFTASASWVDPGTTVRWINDDDQPHDVIGWTFGLRAEALQPGNSYDYTFTEPGVYPYACWLHPGMTGVVVVGSPARPANLRELPPPGTSGEIRAPGDPALEPVAATETDKGTLGSAAAIAGVLMGTIGFVAGRRRREQG